jgi:glycosyltransferase involved in cell wall biosynthesis
VVPESQNIKLSNQVPLETNDEMQANNRPVVSIITVTRNLINTGRKASFLAAMDCVQSQSETALEHVILDGASDDGAQELIKTHIATLAAQSGHVPVVYRSEPDAGLYDAMNKAVALARGQYVVFLNSDDGLAGPDVMRNAVTLIRKDAPDFLYGATLQLLSDGGSKLHARTNLAAFLQRMPFCHNSVLIRRSLFLEMGGHDLRYRVASDYDLVVRLLMAGARGTELPCAISMFATRGVSGNSMAVAQDYARIWIDHYASYCADPISQDEAVNWYRRGHLPVSLCVALIRDGSVPASVHAAARHSLSIALRRFVQPWRTWNNIGD